MMTSWIHTVAVMRNICAHNSRIYNRVISTRPELLRSDIIRPVPQYSGLYQVMLSMKYLRPSDESWNTFITAFKSHLKCYSGIYELNRMSFPNDWETHFQI